MRESLKESKQSFQKLFYADSNNPQITIPGMSILTPDRPIDSPRYISFQGINHNEIKLIYPNLFKVEAFHHHNNLLKLKTPQELKQALKTYFENKVREYNTLLSQEREAAIKHNLINSPHYHYLYQVNPLATPTLEKTIRPYQLFTYEEFLQAIGGEAVLNTLAELLYYQNIGISHRPLSDDIAQDIKFSQEHFDINKKIDYILSQYLTEQNDQKLTDNNTIAPLILPKYSSQGYEVGFINSSDNDYIANATKNASSSNIFA
ncbi:MAG: hypothetical protein Q4B28_03845 [bacterium]|nr:hypothetical protein [bacterium]